MKIYVAATNCTLALIAMVRKKLNDTGAPSNEDATRVAPYSIYVIRNDDTIRGKVTSVYHL